MTDHILLDTRSFDAALEKRAGFISRYDRISDEYDRIVRDLKKSWSGVGANAFIHDANTVRANIAGLGDVLRLMLDVLADCRDIFAEADEALGRTNREASENDRSE